MDVLAILADCTMNVLAMLLDWSGIDLDRFLYFIYYIRFSFTINIK